MLANSYGLDKIVWLLSQDGLNWFKATDQTPHSILIDGGANQVLSPFLELGGPNSYNVYFAYSEASDKTSTGFHSIHEWNFSIAPSPNPVSVPGP